MNIPDKEAEKVFLSLCAVYGKVSVFVGYLNRRDLLAGEKYTANEKFDEYGFSRKYSYREVFAEIQAEFQKAVEAMEKIDPEKV